MPDIWEGLAKGIERAGERWSGSIRRELERKKVEEYERRMLSFKMGEEEKARKKLMKLKNKYAIDLERGKAALGSELNMYLGSPQLQVIMTEALESGQPALQLQALGMRDLITRIQRLERPTPQDEKLLQGLPPIGQAPIAMGMGRLKQYYDKLDMDEKQFQQKERDIAATISYKEALIEALEEKRNTGTMTPENAQKVLESSTKGLAALYKDEYFRTLLKMVGQGGEESLKEDQRIAWRDFMERYSWLRGSIAGAKRVLGISTPSAPQEEIVPLPEGEGIVELLQNLYMSEGAFGEIGTVIEDLLTKGYTEVLSPASKSIMATLKKAFEDIASPKKEK